MTMEDISRMLNDHREPREGGFTMQARTALEGFQRLGHYPGRIYDVHEVARILGCSERSVQRRAKNGDILSVFINGMYCFGAGALLDYLDIDPIRLESDYCREIGELGVNRSLKPYEGTLEVQV